MHSPVFSRFTLPCQRPYDIHSSNSVESLIQLFSTVSVQYSPAWPKDLVSLLRKVRQGEHSLGVLTEQILTKRIKLKISLRFPLYLDVQISNKITKSAEVTICYAAYSL